MTLSYPNKQSIINDFKNYVSSGKVHFFQEAGIDLVPGERKGCFLHDMDGKAYLNCHCNGGVFNLGHRNPKIISALQEALKNWDIGNHHLISGPKAMLGARFAELLPGDINHTVFGVGGGEAIDLAIKLARGYLKKRGIISASGGFHGHTGFALAAGDEQYRDPFFSSISDEFSQVEFDNLAALENAIQPETAAVILETIPATLGIKIPSDDYFKGVREICDKYGVLMIIDEVQSGLGRTGRMWAIEEYEVVPDILVIGKGLSGGIYPISATCFREPLEAFFQQHPFIHISTFGGSELGCFTALTVLNETASPEFLQHVKKMAGFFTEKLNPLQKQFPALLLEIRQKGLMMGLKFPTEKMAMGMCKFLYDNGVFVVFSGNDASVIQLLPPLIIQEEEAQFVINALELSLQTMLGMLAQQAP